MLTSIGSQWLSISVPLVVWSGDAKGSTAKAEFRALSYCLWFGIYSDVRLALPVNRFGEDEGGSSNGRSESRNTYLSNVRPENRSTLCSVMAQLTEDVQPSFETTLKSKAVSENCNVKFTCVISEYKSRIFFFSCTLDDAAIYQVSASNSKGIVSCSGVLEVGTMNEYKIHQRFFAKLKQKAEKKKRDVEDKGKKDNKENIQKEEQRSSPEHSYRKRSVPPLEEKPVVNNSAAAGQPGDAAESKAVSSGNKDAGEMTPVNSSLENEESEETLAKKRIKMSNGVDTGVNSSISRSHMMGVGGENSYDGGIGLAQFLSETLQSQSPEENQEEKCKDTDAATLRDNKENDTASISSMLHSVKDFFFGKSKKDSHSISHAENEEDFAQSTGPSEPEPDMPPSFQLQVEKNSEEPNHMVDNVLPMETDKAVEPSESVVQQAASAEPLQFNCEYPDVLPDFKPLPETVKESAGKRIGEAVETIEAMEVSAEGESSSPVEEKSLSRFQVHTEVSRTVFLASCHFQIKY
ncbi:hypothetical protein GOODEAATRI_001737 [Goodea atripinnis]|uniref:non-specific serine/threonine protein kinase n=1 Tax=Goodea atripinnis TaxID=208336 RepID=A0ABV0NJ50_9TELE